MTAQETRATEIASALREFNEDIRRTDLPNGDIKVSADALSATIHTDGTVTRTWADGSVSRES